jgi:hypothetical protein
MYPQITSELSDKVRSVVVLLAAILAKRGEIKFTRCDVDVSLNFPPETDPFNHG